MGEMLKWLGSVFLHSISSDVTPEERKAARRVFVKVGWRVLVFVLLFWSYGLFEGLGLGSGFARASDIDTKIAAANKKLSEQLDVTSRGVAVLAEQVNEQLANGVATEIRRITGKRCKELDPAEKDRLTREIDRQQEQFFKIKQRYYQVPGCIDL